MAINNLIIYQSYGSEISLMECAYSLYSLLPFYNNETIVIYTDNINFFKNNLPPELIVKFVELDNKTINNWKKGFTHRLKIKMLLDVVERVPDSNYLYLDSDTCFLSAPRELFNKINDGYLSLHTNEGKIFDKKANKIFKKIQQYVYNKKKHYELIPETTTMWNAGVIGFRYDKANLLNEVLELTDKLYPYMKLHVVEQLAFSIVAPKHGKIIEADKYILHYWFLKKYFHKDLKKLFTVSRNIDDLKNNYPKILPKERKKPGILFKMKHFIKNI